MTTKSTLAHSTSTVCLHRCIFKNKIVAGLLALLVYDLRNEIWCCYGNYMAVLKPCFKISCINGIKRGSSCV